MSEQEKKHSRSKSDLLDRVVADAIDISDRFSAEPVFGPTGKGFLKSEGVEPLKELKKERESR